MVEGSLDFDRVFQALGDGTRRDVLFRVLQGGLTISELAARYQMTFAGVAKHVEVLFKAGLVRKQRQGREQWVTANSQTVQQTAALLDSYEQLWRGRLGRLDNFLEQESTYERTDDHEGHSEPKTDN